MTFKCQIPKRGFFLSQVVKLEKIKEKKYGESSWSVVTIYADTN